MSVSDPARVRRSHSPEPYPDPDPNPPLTLTCKDAICALAPTLVPASAHVRPAPAQSLVLSAVPPPVPPPPAPLPAPSAAGPAPSPQAPLPARTAVGSSAARCLTRSAGRTVGVSLPFATAGSLHLHSTVRQLSSPVRETAYARAFEGSGQRRSQASKSCCSSNRSIFRRGLSLVSP